MEISDQIAKRCQRSFGRFAERGMLIDIFERCEERQILFCSPLLQLAYRLRANLAVWYIHDALQAEIVIWISQQTQISQHIFNFFTVIELAATYDFVRDIHAQELLFNCA